MVLACDSGSFSLEGVGSDEDGLFKKQNKRRKEEKWVQK